MSEFLNAFYETIAEPYEDASNADWRAAVIPRIDALVASDDPDNWAVAIRAAREFLVEKLSPGIFEIDFNERQEDQNYLKAIFKTMCERIQNLNTLDQLHFACTFFENLATRNAIKLFSLAEVNEVFKKTIASETMNDLLPAFCAGILIHQRLTHRYLSEEKSLNHLFNQTTGLLGDNSQGRSRTIIIDYVIQQINGSFGIDRSRSREDFHNWLTKSGIYSEAGLDVSTLRQYNARGPYMPGLDGGPN